MRGIKPPTINTAGNERAQYGKHSEHRQYGNPNRRARKLVLVGMRSRDALLAPSHVIFGKQIFFVQSQEAGDGAHESAVESAARKLVPLFIFQRFQIAWTDARGRSDFLKRYFTHLALALQALAKSSRGHESKPSLTIRAGPQHAMCPREARKIPSTAL